MIIATAGHVDHGKTALVKALTGIDADRLPEEKRRGMTVDLGFAYRPTPSGRVAGFIDVPGHEDFVHNMLTGVTGIDIALLVVAADDGVMPQTREHLAILDLLGVGCGAVALTKIDRVDAARAAEAADEISMLLAGTTLGAAPIFPVSAISGDGIAALARWIDERASEGEARAVAGNFRLAIDRAFTVAGAGIVVTGTVFAGMARAGEALVLSPSGRAVRLRGIHAQGSAAEVARAGERAALNLAGDIALGQIKRGDWVVAAAAHIPARRIDAHIRLLASEARALAHWTPAHLHLGAADVIARIAVLEGKEIAPGDAGLVQLVCDRPIGALFGDRFILRDQSARRTLGGGTVIDIFPPPRGRARPERIAALHALETQAPAAALAALLAAAPDGVDLDRFVAARNLTATDSAAALAQSDMVVVEAEGARLAFARQQWEGLSSMLCTALAQHHQRAPQETGIAEAALRASLPRRLPPTSFAALIRALLRDARIARTGAHFHLPRHAAKLAPADEALWRAVAAALERAGRKVPSVPELATALATDLAKLKAFLRRAAARGLLYQIAENRYALPAIVALLAAEAERLAQADASRTFTVAAFRDRAAIGRNFAIELLEFFDKSGFTRRSADKRTTLISAARKFGGS